MVKKRMLNTTGEHGKEQDAEHDWSRKRIQNITGEQEGLNMV